MALSQVYYQNLGRLAAFFQQIKDANAPEVFSQQILKDWGYTSSNDRALIPLLKSLGFLSADGKPTNRYLQYRDNSISKQVLGDALKEAYSDIFLIKSNPKSSDRDAIQGKFKSVHNASDATANLMAKTFFSLLEIADINSSVSPTRIVEDASGVDIPAPPSGRGDASGGRVKFSGLHYNIQIHLPATKDVEVYNAIFKSLKEHLIE